jgi:hypothetical protein
MRSLRYPCRKPALAHSVLLHSSLSEGARQRTQDFTYSRIIEDTGAEQEAKPKEHASMDNTGR